MKTDREGALEWAFSKTLPGRHKAVLLSIAWLIDHGSTRAIVTGSQLQALSGMGGADLWAALDDLISAGILMCEGPRPGSGQLDAWIFWFVDFSAR